MHSVVSRLLPAAGLCLALAGAAMAQGAPQGTWSMKAAAPIERWETAVVDIGGKIYVVGGETPERQDSPMLQEYDPATGTWRDLAPMPQGASHIGAAVLGGKLYVAGGFTSNVHMGPVDRFVAYDRAANRWQTLAPLSSPRGSVGLAAVAGKLHAIGGRGTDQKTVGTHEVYDPASGKWTNATPLPLARDHLGIVVLDGRIHVFGGRTDATVDNVARHDVFDPATGAWMQAAPMPTPRSSGAAAVYRGLIIYAGGECKDATARTTFSENEAYDPKTGRWSTLAHLPEGLHAFGAAGAGAELYFFGGTHGCGGDRLSKDVLAFRLP